MLVVLPLDRICLHSIACQSWWCCSLSKCVCILLHVSSVAPCQGFSTLYCMLVMVVLLLVRVFLHSIACNSWQFCSLSGFVCTLLHVSHGSAAPLQGFSALYCMLVMVVLLLVRFSLHSIACQSWQCCSLSGFVCTPLHVSHGGVAPCQGLSALYCMLVMVVLLHVRVCLHSIACQSWKCCLLQCLSAIYCILVLVMLPLARVCLHSIACQSWQCCSLSGFVCTLLHVSSVTSRQGLSALYCMLVLVVLLLVRVYLHSIACLQCCPLSGFLCTLLHVSHGSVASYSVCLHSIACFMVMLLLVRICLHSIACQSWQCCLLSGFLCTLLHVSHVSVAPCQVFSALYCILVIVVLPLVSVCLHSIACQSLMCCLLSVFVFTLLHVSYSSVASCQDLSALYCMLVMVVLPLVRICLHPIASQSWQCCSLSGFVRTLLHVSHGSVASCQVCLHSIAYQSWYCCSLSGFVCSLLHVSHGSVASCQGFSAFYCMLVMVVLLLVSISLHSTPCQSW